MKWFWFLGLTLAAWKDWREREFPCWILWIWGILGIGNAAVTGIAEHAAAAAVGAAVLLLSRITKGAIGEGDGLFFLLTACYFGFQETAGLFLTGLCFSCVWSMGILLKAHMTSKGCAVETVPFLCCVWMAGLWFIC